MKSVAQAVTGTIYVWAVPKDASYEDMSTGPFKYEISQYSSYHWKTGSVMIHQQEVVVDVPAGIDLISKAFETLEAAKVEAQVEYNRKIAEINQQIKGLLLLTHQPDEDVLDAEYLEEGAEYLGADHE